MNRGCISSGDIHCDNCQRLVRYLERYLVMEEEGGKSLRLCRECATERGLAHFRQEKNKEHMTFFPREGGSS